MAQAQSAIAEAVDYFGHIDVLLVCRSEALVGTIEELSQSTRTLSLVRDQFETNFFAPVNIIRAVLPSMRERKNGHIMVITGISGHLGTPGLGTYCASQWAIEGYCDVSTSSQTYHLPSNTYNNLESSLRSCPLQHKNNHSPTKPRSLPLHQQNNNSPFSPPLLTALKPRSSSPRNRAPSTWRPASCNRCIKLYLKLLQ
jgi:hypothetical protein